MVNGAAYVALSGIGLMWPELSGKAFLYAQPLLFGELAIMTCGGQNRQIHDGVHNRLRGRLCWRVRMGALVGPVRTVNWDLEA